VEEGVKRGKEGNRGEGWGVEEEAERRAGE